MHTFIAIYRGETVSTARLVAASADPELVAEVAARLLQEPFDASDPVITRVEDGRRSALRLIRDSIAAEPD